MADNEDPSGDILIARIASGDRDAFAALYRRYRLDVYRFAVHTCGSTSLAEDVLQDVFVAVMEHASRYEPNRSGVVPWLLGITRNHVRRWRNQRRILALPTDESDEACALAVEHDPLGDVMRRQDVRAMRLALMKLPVRFREVVVLCDLQELTYADAATALGCAVGTVRSRLHRGRALLGKYMRGTRDGIVCRVPATRPLL